MMDPEHIPDVADNELLARFIVNSDEKRPDGKVSHKLFMPYKWVEARSGLSVTLTMYGDARKCLRMHNNQMIARLHNNGVEVRVDMVFLRWKKSVQVLLQ